jgi:hypothetical protein
MYTATENGVLKTVESWYITIPLYDNDGRPFDKPLIEGILNEILLDYPGFSVTNSIGYWKGTDRTYIDQNYQILIDAIPDNAADSSKFFSVLKNELQKRLCQEKIYITKQGSKQELLSFNEFFDEAGVQTPSGDIRQAASQIVKQLVNRFDFVIQRLGYETTSLQRNSREKKIIWERKICGVKLSSELDDTLPDGIKIIAADQFSELGDAFARNQSFAIIGSYEYQLYILEKSNYRSLVEPKNKLSQNYNNPYCLSPLGEPLDVKRFIEEFTMSVFTNWLILREEGFLPKEIKLSIGGDGSLQWTSREAGNIVLHNPATIPEDKIQKQIIECLISAVHLYEDNLADPVAILQAKAKNNYILKRAIVRRIIKNNQEV